MGRVREVREESVGSRILKVGGGGGDRRWEGHGR